MIAFFAAQILTIICTASLLMWPVMTRGTNDLAYLILQSADQWASLPENKRKDYAADIEKKYALTINPKITDKTTVPVLPYINSLEKFIKFQLKSNVTTITYMDKQRWFAFSFKINDTNITIGLPESRIGTAPWATVSIVLLINVLISISAAILISKKIMMPINEITSATSKLGRGIKPDDIREDGPEEIANLAHRFNIMAEQVRDLIEQRTILLAGISHDLRAPLSRLSISLQMMREHPDKDRLDQMEKQINDMSILINQRLDDSRRMYLSNPESVKLLDFLKSIHNKYKDYSGGINIIANDTLQIQADVESLNRVFDNLISNAIHYSSNQPIEISLTQCNSHACINVRDFGPGIPEADLNKVLQPFVRLENANDETGSGLGLSIANLICKQQGWELKLESATERGLNASVKIPIS